MQAQNQMEIQAQAAFELSEDRAAYEMFLEYEGLEESEESAEAFRDCYAGTWDNRETWAENFMDETGELNNIPEPYRAYFDYAAWGRDMEFGGEIWTANVRTGIAVFWNR